MPNGNALVQRGDRTSDRSSATTAERASAPQPKTSWFVGFLIVLTALFGRELFDLFWSAFQSDLNSYIVLIPVVAGYVFYVQRHQLPRVSAPAIGWSLGMCTLASGALILGTAYQRWFNPLSHNDKLALVALSYVAFIWAGAFLLMGRQWFQAAAFPLLFLLFVIPLPDRAVTWMEDASRAASADAAAMFFALIGMPTLRTGPVFELPGLTIEVAEECSGIKSSWVLLITSIVAGQLFLSKAWSRLVLVAAVIPLGILRNGFRIMVIGFLCVDVDPDMIHSVIHRRGGPVFFALSLIPLALILWLLRKREAKGFYLMKPVNRLTTD